jgi:hypothetical protein
MGIWTDGIISEPRGKRRISLDDFGVSKFQQRPLLSEMFLHLPRRRLNYSRLSKTVNREEVEE